jgi:hypothetical protein
VSAFEFFFSFYALLLGLSVAVIATGVATAIQHRKRIRIGWLTPLLALFVGLDIASFWDFAWTIFRGVSFSYGLLIVGLAISLIYFVAASLVFPHAIEDDLSLDDHFWANKKLVLLLTTAANIGAILTALPVISALPAAPILLINYGVTVALYIGLVVPAAFTRNKAVFATLTWIHIAIYLILGALSAAFPNAGEAMLEGAAPAEAGAPLAGVAQ